METVQLTLVRWIEDDHDKLEEHEATQRSALRQLKQLRLGRDDRQETLYNKLLRIRKTFEDAFGTGNATIYLGLEPRLSNLEPLALRRQARETVAILSDPQFTPPDPVVKGIWENPLQYAEQIGDSLTPFQITLDEIASQKREVEKAQKAKTELLEELNERLSWSIRLFEAIYRLAGLGFHADRLRVTIASRPSSDEATAESGKDGESETEGEESKSSETSESSATPSPSETEASAS